MPIQKVTGDWNISVSTTEVLGDGLETGQLKGAISQDTIFGNGTGANNIQQAISNPSGVPITISAPVTYTLSAMTDQIGRSISFVPDVRGFACQNLSNFPLAIGGATSNPWWSPFGSPSDRVICPPLGTLVIVAPTVAGLPVTAGQYDQLKFDPMGQTVSFNFKIVGGP